MSAPLQRLLGSSLDARLFTDLSTLTPQTLITANDRFFVRTAAYEPVRAATTWTLGIGGLVQQPQSIALNALVDRARPMGTHLLECSGNSDPGNFGLMSAARWDGIPIGTVLDRLRALPRATQVLVAGVDDMTIASSTSVPGASWIFTPGDLERAGAFLATHMNGEPLPPNHGFPVRLVVPNWYGCACIKWVNRVELVDNDAPATSQMREFAQHTHQNGTPALARDFEPVIVDLSAMPMRVEAGVPEGFRPGST